MSAEGEIGMGIYLNPGNIGFKTILNGDYIDKTGLIGIINRRINSPLSLTCLSRPRRFGKSFTAKMLCAYYDCICDSSALFENLEISNDETYKKYLNQYNVIALDIAGLISEEVQNKRPISGLPKVISEHIRQELLEYCPTITKKEDLTSCFVECAEITGKRFVFIIDEWDAVIREAQNDAETQKIYLNMLRGWFKNSSFTPKVVAAAYMTGILPIKKDGSQSAISDFKEFTILNPGPFTKYTGFTEDEVKSLCSKYTMDFKLMKKWYDGYEFEGVGALYNPYSVMETINLGEYESHWQKTSASESLITYINMDFDGLQADILKLMADEPLKVNVRTFMNDFESFNSKDDVITLLVHLGYLSYNKNTRTVKIPNNEVKLEFTDILQNPKHTKLAKLIQDSEKLLEDTLAGNENAVSKAIEKIRETNYAPQFYNNEQALRYAVKFAYIVCVDRFMKIEELPSGKGVADMVFVPSRDTSYPAIIIELKWNKESSDAFDQIEGKKYSTVLEGYVGDIVKVGIAYDTDSKVHSCKILKMSTQ